MRVLALIVCMSVAIFCEDLPVYVELAGGSSGRLEYAPDPSGVGSLFRYVDSAGQATVMKTDEIDPFFNAPTLTATIVGQRAIVAGLTGTCPLIASINLKNPARVEKVLPVIVPSVLKDKGRVAFLSWQDRGNANTHTTVVNIWQITETGVLSRVVYPPSNAIENNPQPWVGGSDAVSMVSPLVWNNDGTHLAFVIRGGTDYVYHFVDVRWGDGAEPVVRRVLLPLGKIFSRDPKMYIGGVGLRVRSIEWNAGAVKLSFEPRPYLKENAVVLPEGKPADYLDNKALMQDSQQISLDRLLRFEKTRIDLGSVEKKMHRVEFKYTNPSKNEVSILALAKSCSCFTFEEYDSIVPPKGTGVIGAWVDMAEVKEILLQNIFVLVGSENDVQSLRLTVKGAAK